MYRYSTQEFNSRLLFMGIIRVGTLHDFRNTEHKKGIADIQEGKKKVFHQINNLHIINPDNLNIERNIDVSSLQKFSAVTLHSEAKNTTFQNVTLFEKFDVPDCFILCTSKMCSKETMHEFDDADSCVHIIEIESFYKVLTETLNSLTPVIFRGIHEVIYQKRKEPWSGENWGHHPAVIKENDFIKQRELRAIWQPLCNNPISPVIIGNYRLCSFCRNIPI